MQKTDINQFQGYTDTMIATAGQPNLTRSLSNVIVRYNKVFGRGGSAKFNSVSTVSSTTPIIGLMYFAGTNYTNTTVLRMTPSKVESITEGAGSWTDVTGTALNGSSSTRPQWTNHQSYGLIFTDEGADLPRLWNGSGNTVTLGGGAPYAKAIASYAGFLFLGNTSSDGVTFFPRRILFSADPNNWSACTAGQNEIDLDSTPGAIRAMLPLGDALIIYKDDAVVIIRLIGGQQRFNLQYMRFGATGGTGHAEGIIAPLSLQSIAEFGHIFFATDMGMYVNDGQNITAVDNSIKNELRTVLLRSNSNLCVGVAAPDEETYYFHYPTSSADTWLRGRLGYNWRTGEWFKQNFTAYQVIRSLNFKWNLIESDHTIVSTDGNLVEEVDMTVGSDDGTPIIRYYDTDWQNFGDENPKVLHAVWAYFKRAPGCRVKISIARDLNEKFLGVIDNSLKGRVGRLPAEEGIWIRYDLPDPIIATYFNTRFQFYHDSTTQTELRQVQFMWEPEEEFVTRIQGRQGRGSIR